MEWITSVKFRLGKSISSDSHWLTKTMATLEEAASRAAEVASLPSSNCTSTPGALTWIASRGEEGSQTTRAQQGGQGLPSVRAGPPTGYTWDEPPPESTAISACEPITAIDASFVPWRGSTPVFCSRTAPFSYIPSATAASATASRG